MNTKRAVVIKVLVIGFLFFHWGCVTTSDSDTPPSGTPGTLKWAFEIEWGVFYSSPAVGVDGTIYVGSDNWNLYAINPDGTVKWTFTAEDAISSGPAIGPDGTIYVGSYDGKLYAIYSSSKGLADSPWPMFHHDLRHTGNAGRERDEGIFGCGAGRGTVWLAVACLVVLCAARRIRGRT